MNVHSPVSGATTVPVTRIENSSGTSCPTGPMNVNSPRPESSVYTGVARALATGEVLDVQRPASTGASSTGVRLKL